MALEIVAAKDLNHAFEIVSVSLRKTMEHHVVSEPEGIGGFLYDNRNALANYTYYYQFDPYREIQLEADQVSTIKTFSQSIVKWLAEYGTEENRVIQSFRAKDILKLITQNTHGTDRQPPGKPGQMYLGQTTQ